MGREDVENKNLILERKIKASQILWKCKTWYNKILCTKYKSTMKTWKHTEKRGQQEGGKGSGRWKEESKGNKKNPVSRAQQRCGSLPALNEASWRASNLGSNTQNTWLTTISFSLPAQGFPLDCSHIYWEQRFSKTHGAIGFSAPKALSEWY
jgi:hypothetical protein